MRKNCWPLAAGAWLLLSVWSSSVASASTRHYSVKVWNSGDGLPQNSVLAMTQTRDGYLWLGTFNGGLARFDGTHFTIFNESNTPELTSGEIVKLFEDSQGNLWIGTKTAGIFLAKDGKIKAVDLGPGARLGKLMSICEDGYGAVWLYTATGELCRYQNGKGSVWNAGADYVSRCRALVAEEKLLWVGTDRSLVALGPLPPAAAAGLALADEKPIRRRLDFLVPSKRGGYWRLADGSIQKWRGNQLEHDLGSYPWSESVPVAAACEDRDGNLVVGTYGEGVYWFDAGGHFTRLTAELPSSYILSLMADREGFLWVGTDGRGLARVRQQFFEVLESSRERTVNSVCADSGDGVWIGYHHDRVERWNDGKLQQITNFQYRPKPGSQLYVKSVFMDRRQQVWAGTDGGGLLELHGDRFQPAPGWERLPDSVISAIYQDYSNRLWVGTTTIGLARRDAAGWKLFTTRDGLSANVIRAIAEDRGGSLWVGTQGGGLNRLREGQWSRFSKTNGLPSDNVFALYVDSDDVLWAGTASSLARFKQGKWLAYPGRLGLNTGTICYLLEDAQGFLWIGSTAGLVRVRKKDLNDFADISHGPPTIRSFGEADGLPSTECSQGAQPAACRAQDGTLWFPTTKGLVSVNPALLAPNTNAPQVILESVLIDEHLQGSDTLRAPPVQAVIVPVGSESLEFNFTSLNFSAPDKGRFKFRMDGYETAWTERPGYIHYARYPKLPPGQYQFHVTACNEDGLWNPAGCSLAVTVLPAFWQTRWFLLVVSLGLLGMVVGSVYYVSTQKLQRQLGSLRQQEALEKERARIARDLHDQLGANLTQVALLGEMAETDKDQPGEVEAHARQISHTARDTTRALDEIVWTVNPSNDTLDGLINYVCKYAQEYLALAGLRYRLEVPPQLPNTPISPELRHNVFLGAKEAVNNVVKHSQATAAWLRLHLEPDRFTLEIEDNGRGLAAGDEQKGRNGLRNMRKRMEDLGGQFEITRGATGGTKVRLTAPLTQSTKIDAGPPAS